MMWYDLAPWWVFLGLGFGVGAVVFMFGITVLLITLWWGER